MKIIIIYFLVMSGASILIAVNGNPPPLTAKNFTRIIYGGSSIITDSSAHKLTLNENAELGGNDRVIVWAGKYDNVAVAVKFFWNEDNMRDEIAIYQALGALDDKNIEDKGIPRVYYHGSVLSNYYAIAMTLFDDTLESRYLKQGQHFSNLSVLLIFKRLIEILKYFSSKNVVHNDIKPENIFLRGRDVFIGDFDVATLNGAQYGLGNDFFGSMNYFNCRPRTAMDDLESLLYTMWSVAGIPMGGPSGRYNEGEILAQCAKERKEDEYIEEKYKNVRDMNFKNALNCVSKEVFSWGAKPRYDDLIPELNSAIKRIQAKKRETGFEWLEKPSTSTGSPNLAQSMSKLNLGFSLTENESTRFSSRRSAQNAISTRSSSPRLPQNISTGSSGFAKSGGSV